MANVVREGAKTYIAGVRKVTWASGEMCEFASSLAAMLEALGEACSYDDLTCIAGAAWRFTLNPGQWDYRNYGIRNICAEGYQPVRRTLQMVGLDYTLVERARYDAAYGTPRPDEPAAAVLAEQREDTQRIKDSIDRGAPVLAFGVVGPS
ncbi:MAG: hypothetical protein LLG44_14065, partial [Chloroflexi bacterium]|nr:hypothetical protein [Chloroflexota bacterium]